MLTMVATASAQGTGTLTGAVRDVDGQSKAFANVVILTTKMGAMTDSDGKYTVKNVPVGTYTIRVSFLGYENQERTVQINAGATTTANFEIKTTVVATMQTVRVEATKELIRRGDSGTQHRAWAPRNWTGCRSTRLPRRSPSSPESLRREASFTSAGDERARSSTRSTAFR